MGGGDEYAGDVSPSEAWAKLQEVAASQLIDVRTLPEWTFVGTPELDACGKVPVLVSWQTYPEMTVNHQFVEEVQAKGIAPGQPLFFICRSGARSRAAAIAMTRAGFGPCYNISGGFEGDLDAARHRGQKNGWKVSGLAWKQG